MLAERVEKIKKSTLYEKIWGKHEPKVCHICGSRRQRNIRMYDFSVPGWDFREKLRPTCLRCIERWETHQPLPKKGEYRYDNPYYHRDQKNVAFRRRGDK